MTQYFVIGDVHGKIGMLEEVLTKWDGKSQLIFLGDLIDRGEDSRAVLERVKGLVEQEGAICIFGNHEFMFLSWLDKFVPDAYMRYCRNGGDTTINSILGRPLDAFVDPEEDARRIEAEAADLVTFMRNMPFYLETDKYIFVHAGLDLSLPDWRDTSDRDKVWIREEFHEGKNKTGKTIVFGHTPTPRLLDQPMGTKELWIKDQKIGMDGGAVYGGVLHGILLDDEQEGILQHHVITNN